MNLIVFLIALDATFTLWTGYNLGKDLTEGRYLWSIFDFVLLVFWIKSFITDTERLRR